MSANCARCLMWLPDVCKATLISVHGSAGANSKAKEGARASTCVLWISQSNTFYVVHLSQQKSGTALAD